MSTECSQGFIAFSDTESVERSNNFQLGEDPGSAQTVQGFRDQRQRVSVLDGNCVEASVVYTEIKASFRFLYKEDRCGRFRMTDSDESFT